MDPDQREPGARPVAQPTVERTDGGAGRTPGPAPGSSLHVLAPPSPCGHPHGGFFGEHSSDLAAMCPKMVQSAGAEPHGRDPVGQAGGTWTGARADEGNDGP